MSQVETGNIQLKLQAADPGNDRESGDPGGDAFRRSKRGYRSIHGSAEDLPLIHADVEKTSWVLINFLTNAIKFSPDRSDYRGVGRSASARKWNSL